MLFKVGYWAVILGLHFISSSGFIVDEDEGFPRASNFRDTRDRAEPISTRNLQHDRHLDRNYRNTDRDRYKESSVLTRRSFERIDERQPNSFRDLFREKVDESTERTRNGDRQTYQRTDSERGDVTRIVQDRRSREPVVARTDDRERSHLSTQARNPERSTEDRISHRQNSRRDIFYNHRRVTERSVEDRDRDITGRVLSERDGTGTQLQRAHDGRRSYRITNPFIDQRRRALINVVSRRVRSIQFELVERESDRRQTEIEHWNSRDTRKVGYRLEDRRHNLPDMSTQTGISARSSTENPSISATKDRHQNPTSKDKPSKQAETIRSGRVLRERTDRIVPSEIRERGRELSRVRNNPFGRIISRHVSKQCRGNRRVRSVKANARASEDRDIHQSARQEREQDSSNRFERSTQRKDQSVEHRQASDRAYLRTRSNSFNIIVSQRVSMERRDEVANQPAEVISRVSDSLDRWESATQSLERERNKRKSGVQERERELSRPKSNLFQMMRFRQVSRERRDANRAININPRLLQDRESATRSSKREREISIFRDERASERKSESSERRVRATKNTEIQERNESITSRRVLGQRKDEVANRRAPSVGRVTQNRDHRESATRLLERDTTSFQRERATESKDELQNNDFRDRDSRKAGFAERQRSNLQREVDRVRYDRQNSKLELREKLSQSSIIRHKRQTSEVTRIRREKREEENTLVRENRQAEDTSPTRLEMRFQEQQSRSISTIRQSHLADDRRDVTRSRFLDRQREIISERNDERSTDHLNRQQRDVKHSGVYKLSLDRPDRGDTMIETRSRANLKEGGSSLDEIRLPIRETRAPENDRDSVIRSVHRQDRQRDDRLKARSLEERRQSIDSTTDQRFRKRKTRQPEDVTPARSNERFTFAVRQERDENNNEERRENSAAKEYRNLPAFDDYQKVYTKMLSNLLATTISLVLMLQIVMVSIEPKRFRLCNLRNTLWPTKQKIL